MALSNESSFLLAPDPGDLPLLFEGVRLLGRFPHVQDALDPLLQLLVESGRLSGGVLALAEGVEGPVRIAANKHGGTGDQSSLAVGGRVHMGEGPLGRVLERSEALSGADDEGPWIAVPVTVKGALVAIFMARPGRSEPGSKDIRSLVEALGVLLGEAIQLRRSIHGAEGREELTGSESQARPHHFQAMPVLEEGFGDDELPGLIGRSAAIREVRHLIARVGPTEATVLITGESGTGKERAARALHEASGRKKGPFIAVNCAALPESLIESELFGHERGAFTGADSLRKGRFELASGGTLFLDEIGELGSAVQAKLLRVLQERSFERVGGGSTIKADVRVLAATNRDLEKEVAEGLFREDLFWRLNVFPIRMPPLRERGGDIVLLADHFALGIGLRLGKPVLRISTPAIDLFMSYHWPGNVRELENAIERAVVLSSDGVIHAWQLPPSLQSAASTGTAPLSTLDATLARMERELIVEALKMSKGKAVVAAQSLGITERRFGLALRKYAIDWHRFRTKM